jgi:predicted phosphodiesterase
VARKIHKEDILEVVERYREEYGEDPSIKRISIDLRRDFSDVGIALEEYGITLDMDLDSAPTSNSNVTSISKLVPPDLSMIGDDGELIEEEDNGEVEEYEVDEDWRLTSEVAKKCYAFMLQKKNTQGVRVVDICDYLDVAPRIARQVVQEIHNAGKYIIWADDQQSVSAMRLPELEGNTLVVNNINIPYYRNYAGDWAFRVAIIADTHFCSKAQQVTYFLETMARIQADDKIACILHLGDLVDGSSVYTGHANEVFLAPAMDQLDYTMSIYPPCEIPSYIIAGNHDEDHLKKRGVNVVERFTQLRDEYTYLGLYNERVKIGGVEFLMYHGNGGITENPWTKIKKAITGIDNDNLPDVVLCGHWHVPAYINHRGVPIYSTASFQGGTSYLSRMGIETQVGAMVLEIGVNDSGEMVSHSPLYWQLKRPIKEDYPDIMQRNVS